MNWVVPTAFATAHTPRAALACAITHPWLTLSRLAFRLLGPPVDYIDSLRHNHMGLSDLEKAKQAKPEVVVELVFRNDLLGQQRMDLARRRRGDREPFNRTLVHA